LARQIDPTQGRAVNPNAHGVSALYRRPYVHRVAAESIQLGDYQHIGNL
jgi:hypothetical protein